MDPIMMDEEHTKEIMEREGVRRSERPYQYKINKKRGKMFVANFAE